MIVVGDDFYVCTVKLLHLPFFTSFLGGFNAEINQDNSRRLRERNKTETWSSKWQTDQREFGRPHDIDHQGMVPVTFYINVFSLN